MTSPPFAIVPKVVNLLDELDVERLFATLDSLVATHGNPVLVIVDTLARSMVGGDANSAQDMGRVRGWAWLFLPVSCFLACAATLFQRGQAFGEVVDFLDAHLRTERAQNRRRLVGRQPSCTERCQHRAATNRSSAWSSGLTWADR